MSNKSKFSLVILSAVLLSACTAKAPANSNKEPGDNKAPETEQSLSTSMRDLIAAGKSQKCMMSLSDTSEKGIKTETQGTLYISGNKIAEEITITSSEKAATPIKMMMVADGTNTYTWDPATKMNGMMYKMPEVGKGTNEGNTGKNGSVNLDEKINMKCSAWTADNGKFTVPTDVKFTDLSEMMKNIPTIPAGVNIPK